MKEQKEKERKDKERKAQEAKSAAQDERKLQKLQEDARKDMSRMAGGVGASGSPNATGGSSAPSAGYGGRIIKIVREAITFTQNDVIGNPKAVVQVRTALDGKVIGVKLITSSGNKAWDDAVLRSFEKIDKLPRDTDGTIPSFIELTMGFRD